MVRVLETQTVTPNSIPLPLYMVLELSIRSSASPCSAAVWPGFWNSDQVVLKSSIRSLASPRSVAVWLGLWTSKPNETRSVTRQTGRVARTDRSEGWNSYVDFYRLTQATIYWGQKCSVLLENRKRIRIFVVLLQSTKHGTDFQNKTISYTRSVRQHVSTRVI